MPGLIPAARAARAAPVRDRRSLSRDSLPTRCATTANGVSNSRASLLLKILKAESDVTVVGPAAVPSSSSEVLPPSEAAA